jgi:prephenate dehydrogenase
MNIASKPLAQRMTVIGIGLIGGSLARAARAAGLCNEIVGAGRSADHLQRAVDLGVIDRYETDLAKAVAGADLVLLAVPLGAMKAVFEGIKGHLDADAVVTDAGSAKASVVEDAVEVFGALPPNLVPGHPIAGTENSGVEASFAELFQGRRVILTPTERTDERATDVVRKLWEGAGAQVTLMDVRHHDEVLAATSHLPHVLAYTLVDTLARMGERDEIFQYAAGGFRDFTRIASSDPVMWRDICLANHDALLAIVERYQEDLDALAKAIRGSDSERILEIFTRAKQARDRYCNG